MRPQLPSAERLLPYLKSIDASRLYSNFGPLVVSFEDRIAQHYALEPGSVASVANATLGLTIALAIQQPPVGSLCIIPAWTFVASAHAAIMAGLVPYFVDVDPETWALTPSGALDVLAKAPAQIGAVMPVMPFGLPCDVAAWDAFRSETGIAVAIDAAAAFDALAPAGVPSVVSLHATKTLGTGEGGLIISTDASIRSAVWMHSNFGFRGSRRAQVPACNAKLCEYQAAVGHASLDEWPEARTQWVEAANRYRRALQPDDAVRLQNGFGVNWVRRNSPSVKSKLVGGGIMEPTCIPRQRPFRADRYRSPRCWHIPPWRCPFLETCARPKSSA
jgi:dTDP-4-amino-4,6-dideoxygalactose transaminase